MADSSKKDILEFPLEDVSIPQAIVLMMQAATTTVSFNEHDDSLPEKETDNDRLQLLAEKLEVRVEDEIEAAKAVRTETVEEDNPNEALFSDIDGHQVTLVHEFVEFANDNIITQVVVDNIVFGLLCNERVFTDPETMEVSTCVLSFGHENTPHVDMKGNIR